jgi:hypothetical protein
MMPCKKYGHVDRILKALNVPGKCADIMKNKNIL